METKTLNIYQKLHEARKYIKTCGIEKKGWNNYSKYKYYTPEQISDLAFRACEDQGLLTIFDLLRNELGITGGLKIMNLSDTNEVISFTMASAIPEIKATNAIQQLGGAVTYTERYLLMSAFDIKDNNLDPDTSKKEEPLKEPAKTELKWLNKWADKEHNKENDYYWKVVGNAKENSKGISDLKLVFKISKEVKKN